MVPSPDVPTIRARERASCPCPRTSSIGPSRVWENGPWPRSCSRAAARTWPALGVAEPEPFRHPTRDRERSQGVLEARVVRPGEHEVGEAGLPDPPQPLECLGADEFEGGALEHDRPVDRVEDRLSGSRGRRSSRHGTAREPVG